MSCTYHTTLNQEISCEFISVNSEITFHEYPEGGRELTPCSSRGILPIKVLLDSLPPIGGKESVDQDPLFCSDKRVSLATKIADTSDLRNDLQESSLCT